MDSMERVPFHSIFSSGSLSAPKATPRPVATRHVYKHRNLKTLFFTRGALSFLPTVDTLYVYQGVIVIVFFAKSLLP
jgi:hypothetical protein